MENQTPQENLNQTPQIPSAGEGPLVTQTSKPKPKISLSAIIGITIFLLLAGGAAASFTVFKPQIMSIVSKPTPTLAPSYTKALAKVDDPIADWKTYKSDGFSFKYPIDWHLSKEPSPSFFRLDLQKLEKTNDANDSTAITILVNTETQAVVEKKILDEFSGIKSGELSFGSLNWNVYTGHFQNTWKVGHASTTFINTKEFITTNNNKTYWIRLFSNQDSNTSDINIVDTLVSTFKFTDTQTTENTSWKLFENELFSFKYPEEWIVTENNGQISLKEKPGGSGFVNLEIYTKPDQLTDYSSIPTCDKSEPNKKCIATEGWEQKKPIENVSVGNKKSVSFYLTGFGDYARHVIQTLESPKIEFNMNVAGGGLDGIFSKIISTIKFKN